MFHEVAWPWKSFKIAIWTMVVASGCLCFVLAEAGHHKFLWKKKWVKNKKQTKKEYIFSINVITSYTFIVQLYYIPWLFSTKYIASARCFLQRWFLFASSFFWQKTHSDPSQAKNDATSENIWCEPIKTNNKGDKIRAPGLKLYNTISTWKSVFCRAK